MTAQPLPTIELKNSVHGSLMLAVEATLNVLAMPGLTAWHKRKQLWDVGLKDAAPCGIIAFAGRLIDWNAGQTETEDISYGISIAMIAAGNYDNSVDSAGCQLLWPEMVSTRFLNRRDMDGLILPDGAALIRTNVIPPSETFLEAAAKMGWDAQYCVLRFVVRQERSMTYTQ